MSTIDLHPAPSYGAVAREQLRTAALALRLLVMVVAAIFFGVFLTILGENNGQTAPPVLTPHFISVPAVLIAAIIPFFLWDREGPSRRAYFLSMPVGRFEHHLLKNGAGWVWAMAATALLYPLVFTLVPITNATVGDFAAWQWAAPVVTATVAYLVSASLTTGADYPGWWFFGGYVAFGFLSRSWPLNALLEGRYGVAALLGGVPGTLHATTLAEWLVATALWVGMGVAALWVASRLHRDV